MADTPETTANQEKLPVDQIMDRVNELFGVIDTLIDDDQTDPLQEYGENTISGTPESSEEKTPARRLLDITGGLIDIASKLADAETPGHWQEFTDAEAESAGVFDEDAISEDDAYVSSFDNPDA
jgi:hypothetical protein